MARRTYNIAMVSDFFFPQPGGVESHIYQVSSKLVDRGHKVVIITHEYADRKGVRYLTNGIKVYYVPFLVIYRSATMPTVFSFFPIFRNIVIRERIDIVHGHASLSNFCHEAILHARTMGLRTVFTDHSLFGFADATSILANKLLKFTLSDVDHVICVSHTCKENTVLRASLDPLMVSVIPNALVAENFRPLNHPDQRARDQKLLKPQQQQSQTSQAQQRTQPQPQPQPQPQTQPQLQTQPQAQSRHPQTQQPPRQPTAASAVFPPKPFGSHMPLPAHQLGPHDTITIVVISRLFYNKGTDLLVAAIPRILENHPNTRFIIAGAGPKAIDLKQMIEQNVLQDRVEMLGPVRHEDVRDVMVRGHIYLHPSLTEAFGTVIVEAASCGLYVVCTQVGGIPEVLPSHMTEFARPDEDDLVAATGRAIAALRTNKVRTERFHDQVQAMYSWTNVAARTERVYNGITGAISEAEFYGYDLVAGAGRTATGKSKHKTMTSNSSSIANMANSGGNISSRAANSNNKSSTNIHGSMNSATPAANSNSGSNINTINGGSINNNSNSNGNASNANLSSTGAGGGWNATRGRSGVQSFALIDRLKRYYGCGIWAGKLFCLCVVVDYLLFLFCEFWWPRDRIDICPDWPRKTLHEKDAANGHGK